MVGSHLADYLLAHTDWELYGMCRWRSPQDNVRHLLDRVNRTDRLRNQTVRRIAGGDRVPGCQIQIFAR